MVALAKEGKKSSFKKLTYLYLFFSDKKKKKELQEYWFKNKNKSYLFFTLPNILLQSHMGFSTKIVKMEKLFPSEWRTKSKTENSPQNLFNQNVYILTNMNKYWIKTVMSCISSSSLHYAYIPPCTPTKERCNSSFKNSSHWKADWDLAGAAFPMAEIELATATLKEINTK